MPFVQALSKHSRQNSSPKRPRDATSRASTAPSDAPKSDQERLKVPFRRFAHQSAARAKATQGAEGEEIERQGHRTRDPLQNPRLAKSTRRGSAACKRPPTDPHGLVGGLSSSQQAGKSPSNEKGTLSGPPLPVAHVRASPPRARATRPGGRRRPSLPQGRPCSTIGAGRLNFRVRYGSGCAPAAVAAGPRGALRRGLLGRFGARKAPWGPHSA